MLDKAYFSQLSNEDLEAHSPHARRGIIGRAIIFINAPHAGQGVRQ